MKRLRGKLPVMLSLLAVILIPTAFHLPGGSMFAQDEGSPWEKNYGMDESGAYKKSPVNAKDQCETAASNIERASKAILGDRSSPAVKQRTSWDRKSEPGYFKIVNDRLRLRKKEKEILYEHGFVVLPKTGMDNYGYAYHELYQSELPLYVTLDSVMHAIYLSNDEIIKDLEKKIFEPALARSIEALRGRLAASGKDLPADTLRDMDTYLAVADSLIKGTALPSQFRNDADVRALFDRAVAAKGIDRDVKLFGRTRAVDWSQYAPRGHYANEDFQNYFRAATWLSRTEFNLSSRSCRSSCPGNAPDPAQTPREVLAALALAALAESSGAAADIALVGRGWDLLAGAREDLSLRDVADIRKSAGIVKLDADAAERFIKALGDRFARTVNTNVMPDGTKELPAICTVLGPRITADTGALRFVHDPEVQGRRLAGVCDVAYALGIDRAKNFLKAECAKYPQLDAGLEKSRKSAHGAKDAGDLYSAWYAAIRDMAAKPGGVLPSTMEQAAYEDLRLNGIVAAYGQIRHNYVLMAAQDYFFGGCHIPDGFVEPAPAVYAALMKYAERGAKAMAVLDPGKQTKALPYFERTANTLALLKAISDRELANQPLTSEMKHFLSMVAELEPGTTGSPPVYSGWYFDLFYTRALGLGSAAFIADYFTSPEAGRIGYAGVAGVNLGVFLVDTCGAPRLFVGPVPRAFEYMGPIDTRLTDDKAATLTGTTSPWADGYTAPAHKEPSLSVSIYPSGEHSVEGEIESKEPSGTLLVTLLDHNRKPICQKSFKLKAGTQKLGITLPAKSKSPEAVYLKAGSWEYWGEMNFMGSYFRFGDLKTQEQ